VSGAIESVTLGQVATVAIAVAAGWTLTRRALPRTRAFFRFLDDIAGKPESRPGAGDGRPSAMERLASVEQGVTETRELVDETRAQLHPNGGSSTRDQIDQLTRTLDGFRAEFRAALDPPVPEPRLAADDHGGTTP
jgi:hypothetical protein